MGDAGGGIRGVPPAPCPPSARPSLTRVADAPEVPQDAVVGGVGVSTHLGGKEVSAWGGAPGGFVLGCTYLQEDAEHGQAPGVVLRLPRVGVPLGVVVNHVHLRPG